MANYKKWTNVSRRDFFKTTALAGVAATFPASGFAAQNDAAAASGIKPSPAGKGRNLLFVSTAPERNGKLIEAIKSIKEYEISLTTMTTDYKNPEEILNGIKKNNADAVFMILSGMGNSRSIAESMGSLDIPVILLPTITKLIMWETDLAASFRLKGTNALVANSEDHAIELIKIVSAPRPLEGKRALIFSKPFESTSIPSPNLSADYVYKRTGVRIEHRPIEDLKALLKGVDKAAAEKEMARWKKGAAKIDDVPDEKLLNASRMYVLLRSLIDKEGLSAVSIDCLSFSFSPETAIPLPCLAFTRLRDEGITAACEADVCMLLSSMLMQEVCGRPSFQSNVSSVNLETSSTILRHCVAPTMIFGSDAPQNPYAIIDYHGLGKGPVPVVEYPIGIDVTIGGFSKDLKDFVIWPGRIQETVDDRNTPSFADAPPNSEYSKMRRYCSNMAEIKIRDAHYFLKNIVGIHHNMITGSFGKAISDSLTRMNVNVVAPPDMTPPEV